MSIVGYVAQATSIVPVLMVISIIPAVSSRLVKYLFQEQE
ncbi:unknown [Clostridium sp. CAG:813]|nr:unknown [Clostridium sp. CAG:813]